MTTAAAVALMLAVGACSSSSDDDETLSAAPPPATTQDPTPDPVELAETAYDEYLDALTAYEVAQGVYALTPIAANLAALREAVVQVATEASEALVLAGDGTAAQLVRAQNAVDATVTDSSDVAAIEYAIMAAANLVTALAEAATAATTYDNAKAAYEADGGMTQANLDALSDAAAAAKEKADAAIVLAAGGSAAQLSEAQDAVAAANMADTHVSGITMALEAGIATALTAYDTAKTAHTAAKTAHDEDASLDNANALKTAADALLAAAMKAQELGALGATEEQQTALASVSVTNAGTYVTAAGTAVTTAQTAANAASVVAKTAEAGTKTKALTAEAAQTTVEGLGGSDDDTLTMAISRDRMGTTVSFTDNDMAGEDDPKFALYMDLGEGRTMHTRKIEADADGNVVEEVVIVSTDIDAPKATPFAMVEGQALLANPKTTGGTDYRSIAVVAGIDDVNLPKVMSAAFTAGTNAVLTFDSNDTATDDVDEAFETVGTYNGAMGTYRCDGAADCTVNIEDDKISEIGNGWVFTPNKGVTSDVPDADFLNYGFWLKKTTDEDGVLTYNEVETLAGSSLGDTGSNVGDVEGSVTYNGGATGVYVKNAHNSDGTLDTATAGHFTAAASLKAYFGGDSVAVDDQNSITGTIDKFELSGGEENAWSVALKGIKGSILAVGTASGTANGGGEAGTFNATFHGDTAVYDHDMDDDTDEINRQPSSVVGEFDANFSNGSVAGAFGARK